MVSAVENGLASDLGYSRTIKPPGCWLAPMGSVCEWADQRAQGVVEWRSRVPSRTA